MLGQQGVGKSSIANSLLGYNNLEEVSKRKCRRKKLPFAVGHGLRLVHVRLYRVEVYHTQKYNYILHRSKTKMTSFSTGNWLGFPNSPNVTLVDTPGFKVKII